MLRSITAQRPAFAQAFDSERLVLFPYGRPHADIHRGHCDGLLLRAGGDVRRFVEPPIAELDAFIRYASRMSKAFEQPPMVVLTRTNPIALTVVQARREIEAEIPELARARWFVYLSPEQDPFFLGSAQSLGSLRGPLHRAPIWYGPDAKPYMVLSSCIMDASVVLDGLEQLDDIPFPTEATGSNRRTTARFCVVAAS